MPLFKLGPAGVCAMFSFLPYLYDKDTSRCRPPVWDVSWCRAYWWQPSWSSSTWSSVYSCWWKQVKNRWSLRFLTLWIVLLTSLELFRDYLRLYRENIVERTRDTIKLDILGHVVRENVYVESFKPCGFLHPSIMYLQCEIWNKEWEDKVILSQKAVVSTSPQFSSNMNCWFTSS